MIYCSEQIIVACVGIFDQFLYPVQEFKLKIDTLQNGTSRVDLNESASRVFLKDVFFVG